MSKNITMAVAVDRETESKLVEIAKREGISVSKLIRDAIVYTLKNNAMGGSETNGQV